MSNEAAGTLESDPNSVKKLECIFAEVVRLREGIVEKEKEISRLQREVHKLKSVIDKSDLKRLPSLVTLSSTSSSSLQPTKKVGVSGESGESRFIADESESISIERIPKDFRTRQLMRASLGDNDFLKNLDQEQIRDIVDFMFLQCYEPGQFVIREGEQGSHLYICADGQLEVLQDDQYIASLSPGKAFGELALLYNCKRTASVRAKSFCKIFALERKAFQEAVVRAGMRRLQDRICFLRSVPFFRDLKQSLLARVADCLEVERYEPESYIIREGAVGDTFFILSSGRVKVSQGDLILRELGKGDYFGEQALLRKSQCRSANVIALQGVECLTLDRESFKRLIGDLSEFRHRQYSCSESESTPGGDHDTVAGISRDRETSVSSNQSFDDTSTRSKSRSVNDDGKNYDADDDYPDYEDDDDVMFNNSAQQSTNLLDELPRDLKNIKLDDLEIVATLGIGGFGRVELVQLSYDTNVTFALKCLAKAHILVTQQQEHIFSEKNIMMAAKSPFIARLYKTFKDSKYIYFLMEACLGGEVWTILRDKGSFDEDLAKFVLANVIIALDYLHGKNVVFRDLKPENLMVSGTDGFVKLVDFGFSKIVPSGQRTWTFCGTPEYVAPEVILNRGHDRCVDLWAMGVLLFELLTGLPPWGPCSIKVQPDLDPLSTYNSILKGIESLTFPKMSRNATSLIRRLCKQSPGERLGAQGGIRDVMAHRLFEGFDFDGVASKKMKSPFEPRLRSTKDTTHFDKFHSEFHDTKSDFSGWDADF